MIGGQVIEAITVSDHPKGSRVWINCREKDSTSECAIYVEDSAAARCVEKGDKVWWQSEWAMWSHYHQGRLVGKADIKLKRIGSSGVSRPTTPVS